jgi:uncharacterized GH25 family protein
MKYVTLGLAAMLVALGARPSSAHFQELIPSSNILEGETQRAVTIRVVFTHPMEGKPTMDMGQPPNSGSSAATATARTYSRRLNRFRSMASGPLPPITE